MKKVFNASLVAASLAMAFAANAAVISQTSTNKLVLSQEGISVGETYVGDVVFDIAVAKNHPATTEITLTFSPEIDLSDLDAGPSTCNAPTSGNFACGDVAFNVGTGNFTFEDVVVDADDNTIKFIVSLGNSLSADSAFRVTLGAVNDPIVSGAATVAYSAEYNGAVVDSAAAKAVATTAKQFAFAIDSKLSKQIDRSDRDEFLDDEVEDQVDFIVIDNGGDLEAAATFVGIEATLKGTNFAGTQDAGATTYEDQWVASAAFGAGTGTLNVAKTALDFTFAAGTVPVSDDGTLYSLLFDNTPVAAAGGIALVPQAFVLDAEVEFSGTNGSDTVDFSGDAGEWRLNAAVVNVPYLPIGYERFSPIVEIANRSSADAEVTIEAFGKSLNGAVAKEYKAVTLTKKAVKNGITTITETDIMNAFGLKKGDEEKLTITFTVNAPDSAITLAPYYRENESRVNVITDQYK